MTLHRTVTGWQINAGCTTWAADTRTEVVDAVRRNVADGPPQWAHADEATRTRWAAQVDSALGYLLSMTADEAVAS